MTAVARAWRIAASLKKPFEFLQNTAWDGELRHLTTDQSPSQRFGRTRIREVPLTKEAHAFPTDEAHLAPARGAIRRFDLLIWDPCHRPVVRREQKGWFERRPLTKSEGSNALLPVIGR